MCALIISSFFKLYVSYSELLFRFLFNNISILPRLITQIVRSTHITVIIFVKFQNYERFLADYFAIESFYQRFGPEIEFTGKFIINCLIREKKMPNGSVCADLTLESFNLEKLLSLKNYFLYFKVNILNYNFLNAVPLMLFVYATNMADIKKLKCH